jgi:hypothetical protein
VIVITPVTEFTEVVIVSIRVRLRQIDADALETMTGLPDGSTGVSVSP